MAPTASLKWTPESANRAVISLGQERLITSSRRGVGYDSSWGVHLEINHLLGLKTPVNAHVCLQMKCSVTLRSRWLSSRCPDVAPWCEVGLPATPDPTPGVQCGKRTVDKSQLSHCRGESKRGGGAHPFPLL